MSQELVSIFLFVRSEILNKEMFSELTKYIDFTWFGESTFFCIQHGSFQKTSHNL